MRVRALREGYFGLKLRKEGDIFVLKNPEMEFSKLWMEKFDDSKPKKKKVESLEMEDIHLEDVI